MKYDVLFLNVFSYFMETYAYIITSKFVYKNDCVYLLCILDRIDPCKQNMY